MVKFALVGALLLTCGGTPGPRGSAERCAWVPPSAPTTARSPELGQLDHTGTFVPLRDGDTATLVVGFQGSSMLLAAVRVPARSGDPSETCALIEVERPESTPLTRAILLRRVDDQLQSGTLEILADPGELDLQLRVTSVELEGASTLRLLASLP